MSAAWRLATNSLSSRRSRTALIVAAVTFSAAMISCVACAMATAHESIRAQFEATVGVADLRLSPASAGRTIDADWVERVRAWPEVQAAAGSVGTTLSVAFEKEVLAPSPDGFARRVEKFKATAVAFGIAPDPRNRLLNPPRIVAGRLPSGPGELAIDTLLASRLGWMPEDDPSRDGYQLAKPPPYRAPRSHALPERVATAREAEKLNREQRIAVGDHVQVARQVIPLEGIPLAVPLLTRTARLVVVGVVAPPPLGGRPLSFMTPEGLAEVSDTRGRVSQVDIVLKEGLDAATVAQAHHAELPESMILQTTERITAGVDANIKGSQLGFVLACVMAVLSSAFIISTGLTTNVTERQRELAILRCIGAERRTLAISQLWVGLIVGVIGAAIGVPLGTGIAWTLALALRDHLDVPFQASAFGLTLSFVSASISGLLGAAWPAWRSARTSPLRALSVRGEAPRARSVALISVAALACIALEAAIIGIPDDGNFIFWAYATVGLPAMFVGYFLLGVPVTLAVATIAGPLLSRLLALPSGMLRRTIAATPYRHGLTAGALMSGLALMVAIWTHGGAILRDWIGKINFPDAFVSSFAMSAQHQRMLEDLPFVEGTCAITLHPVETDVFGVRGLQKYKTNFIAFDPDSFFRMMEVTWVQGDPMVAIPRLRDGGAIIVAREFLTAQGLGVGSTIKLRQEETEHIFEIVGVVTSPGLEIVSKFFNIGDDFTNQAIHAVFGTQADLKEKFGSDTIHLIQIDLADDVEDEAALKEIRDKLFGAGILDAGSGRQVKEQIETYALRALLVFSAISVVTMLVACFGVANVVIAGIEARQFEFGVLRAVGARRGMVLRLVLAEAVVIAIAACILGTLMGLQGSWAGQRLDALLVGVSWRLVPPVGAILAGSLAVLILTLLAAAPPVWRLGKKRPRELLGAMRG